MTTTEECLIDPPPVPLCSPMAFTTALNALLRSCGVRNVKSWITAIEDGEPASCVIQQIESEIARRYPDDLEARYEDKRRKRARKVAMNMVLPELERQIRAHVDMRVSAFSHPPRRRELKHEAACAIGVSRAMILGGLFDFGLFDPTPEEQVAETLPLCALTSAGKWPAPGTPPISRLQWAAERLGIGPDVAAVVAAAMGKVRRTKPHRLAIEARTVLDALKAAASDSRTSEPCEARQ